MITSARFERVALVVNCLPIPTLAPTQFVADPAVRDCRPLVRLVAVPAAHTIRVVEVIAGVLAARRLAPL